jgi:hypothetical protein
MNKNIWFKFVLLALGMATIGVGCSPSGTPTTNTSVSKPVISITYTGTFAGQTAAGYLNLVVDINIENKGYQSFDTSPAKFSVQVEDYSYTAAEVDLQTVNLADGDQIGGKLVFQVPPVAGTTRVGYQMQHSGQTLHNIQWSERAISAVSSPASTPEVSITYSDAYMWVKETGSLYLLVDLTIENKGYESFNTSPEHFTLILGNILGESTPRPPITFDGTLSNQKDGAYSDLRSYDLQNGGKLGGKLAFKVPTDIQRATERYKLEYSGVRSYNILWSWEPPQQ